MVGSYRQTGRPGYPDYQQIVQAYRALRVQYEQLAVQEQQQAQRIAQLERALLQATQGRPGAPRASADAGSARMLTEMEAQLKREQSSTASLRAAAEQAEQQAARVEKELRAALERSRQTEETLAAAEAEIARLQSQLAEAGDAAEWRDRYLRQQADADNFRRRQERRFAQQAVEERRALLRDMLPLADNLELGLQHLAQDAAAGDPRLHSYSANLQAVRQAFLDTLERHGVQALPALGEPFDPNFHEALGHLPSDDVPEGRVAHVVQNGFTDPDGLVRPARVLVSAGRSAGPAATTE